MLPRLLLLLTCALSMLVAAPSLAEDAAPETTIQVYRVGDLVAYDAVHRTIGRGKVPPEEWRAEHIETTAALQRLTVLVSSMCSTKATVLPHSETLSLVVRHTADGHREVEQLLKGLRAANEPSIRLTFELTLVGSMDESRFNMLPPEKQKRMQELERKAILKPEEAQEVRELGVVPPGLVPTAHELSLELVPGRKTSLKLFEWPATVTACVTPDQRSIQLRVDYPSDDFSDREIPIASEVFEIPNGSSAILLQTSDGASFPWLITPTIIEPAAAEEARSPATAEKQ